MAEIKACLNWNQNIKKLTLLLPLCIIWFPIRGDAATATLQIDAHVIYAEIANTRKSRAQGLMHRNKLCTDCGMLFVFPQSGSHRFWTKSTPLPLSIAFISSNGDIISIEEMQSNSERVYEGPADTSYCLEMNTGWFSRHEIKPGAKLKKLKHFSTDS